MTTADRGGGRTAKRCPECGVDLKAGLKYCDFCGTRVAVDLPAPAVGQRGASGGAGGLIRWVVAGCLAIGVLAYVGTRLKEPVPPPAPPPGGVDGKRRAVELCEAGIKKQALAPFRVIAFRSTLVADELAGYAVSGTVELQSLAGEVQRKRYFCRIRRDAGAGMILDEGRMN